MTNFQRSMYRWSTWHPYYAASIVEIDGPVDLARLRSAVAGALAATGAAGVEVDAGERCYRFVDSPRAPDVESVALEEGSTRAFERWISTEMNRMVPRDGRFPVRVRLCEVGPRSFIVHLFDHWIGDGWALCCLVDAVFRRYLGLPGEAETPRAGPGAPDLREALPDEYRLRRRLRLAVESVRALRRLRTCYCPARGDRFDLTAAMRFCPVPDDALDRLAACGRARGASVNDVLLAAALEAADAAAPERLDQPRRRDLAAASVSSFRPLAQGRLDRPEGLYLGYFHVFQRGPRPDRFEDLVDCVRVQTAPVKAARTHFRAEWELGCALWTSRWTREAEGRRQILNNNPVAVGVSNTRMPPGRLASELFPPLRSVWFAVSPGPTAPLVIHATSVDNQVKVTFNWRLTAYDEEAIDRATTAFQRRIEGL
jgi:hypothetical protein